MTVFALLVGIDAYRPPVTPLRGCGNDVAAMSRVLRDRAGEALVLRNLLDGEATRAAVVTGLREHLGHAGPGDTALFFYAGHGSQEPSPPQYEYLEPDRLNETLVLVDSRDDGEHDLADKELAVLLSEVAAGGAEVVVILDCCHSGSATRDAGDTAVTVRRTAADHRDRPADTYLPGWQRVVDPPHVLLAACRSDQTAKEVVVNGVPRGAFSAVLQRVLAHELTYDQVIRWAAAGLRNRVWNQTPVLETGGGVGTGGVFLGIGSGSPCHTASFRADRGWVLDAGLVHGIERRSDVELFPMTGARERVAEGRVRAVDTVTADLQLTGDLDTAVTYRADLVRVPTPAVTIALDGDVELRRRLDAVPLVRVVDDGADLRLVRDGDRLCLIRPAGRRPAVGRESTVDGIIRLVAHVSRWLAIADRQGPGGLVPADAAGLELTGVGDTPIADRADGVHVGYRFADGKWVQPRVRIRIVNRSDRRWCYALVVLGESYGVTSLLPGGGIWLDPGAQAWVLTTGNVPVWYLSVPPGEDEAVDVFKLVVCGEEFDARHWEQPGLAGGDQARAARDVAPAPETPADRAGWLVADQVVITERRRESL